jgi:hypothetical protein
MRRVKMKIVNFAARLFLAWRIIARHVTRKAPFKESV